MNLDAALQTFIIESHEMLERMEQGLLSLEDRPDDADLVNEIFRAAHTIKGSAGLFGLDAIVAFTHEVETLLDRIRDGRVGVDAGCVAALLACKDYLSRIIDPVSAGQALEAAVTVAGDQLLAQVRAISGSVSKDRDTRLATVQQAPTGAAVGERLWRIFLQFGNEVLRDGMDPLAFIGYLQKLGDIVDLCMSSTRMPPLAEMDPEACYLDFDIRLRTAETREKIESAFDFVRESCVIEIAGLSDSDPSADGQRLPDPEARLGDILIMNGDATPADVEAALARQAASAPPKLGEILSNAGAVNPEAVKSALERQELSRDRKAAAESRFVRVDADKLDQLIDLVGELVIAGATTKNDAHRSGSTEMMESAAVLVDLVEQIRDRALSLRMVAIGPTFQRFTRVVRDVSKELGKDIELIIRGAETELDKSMVELLGDPLMHLVRNSMDHGIEPVEVRAASGKPPRAHITLDAHHDSGSIVIEVSDDGGGLNREKIRRKAIERGLVTEGQALADREIDQLIFAPGFSTADAISNLSGRGVGMDVVKRNIEALRGTIEIINRAPRGTTVRIRLPLTLAIIDGFLVSVGDAGFVIPLDMIIECLKCTPDLETSARHRGYIDLRGEVLPVVDLREVFRIEDRASQRQNIVVVAFGEQKIGLVVGDLHGEQQTVIKPLGGMFASLRGISGSTVLGNGSVALILDIPQLMRLFGKRVGDEGGGEEREHRSAA